MLKANTRSAQITFRILKEILPGQTIAKVNANDGSYIMIELCSEHGGYSTYKITHNQKFASGSSVVSSYTVAIEKSLIGIIPFGYNDDIDFDLLRQNSQKKRTDRCRIVSMYNAAMTEIRQEYFPQLKIKTNVRIKKKEKEVSMA